MHRRPVRRRICVLSALVAPAALAGVVHDNWTGHGTPANPTPWGNGTNWEANAVPPTGSLVAFGSGFGSGLNISIAGANPVSKFTVNTSQPFILMPNAASPTTPLILQTGTIFRSSTSSGTQSIPAPLLQGGNNSWLIEGTGALVVSGNISGSFAVTKAGAGTLVLGGSNSFAGLQV